MVFGFQQGGFCGLEEIEHVVVDTAPDGRPLLRLTAEAAAAHETAPASPEAEAAAVR